MAQQTCPSCGGSGMQGYDIERNQTCIGCSGRGTITVPDPIPAHVRNDVIHTKTDKKRKNKTKVTRDVGLLQKLFGNNPNVKTKKVEKDAGLLQTLFSNKPQIKGRKEKDFRRKISQKAPSEFFEGLFERPRKNVTDGMMWISVGIGVLIGVVIQEMNGNSGQAIGVGALSTLVAFVGFFLAYYGLQLLIVIFKIALILAFFGFIFYAFSELQ